MSKHAYMIMAHHRPDLLQLLINALDDKRNDIVIHIDKKSDMSPDQFYCNHANMIFIDRIEVNWGGYTQVECEYKLMKEAVKLGKHSYYHLLTGVNYPLWNQDYIHSFFEEKNGKEFIGFDYDADYTLRVKYYVPFPEYGKLHGLTGRLVQLSRNIVKIAQDAFHIDFRNRTTYTIKKGCAYFSITENLVNLIISKESEMKGLLEHTICCDEIFVQTIAYNSEFKDNIYNIADEFDGCLRELAWPSNLGKERPGWNFWLEDLAYLLNSHRLFAMKFESEDGIDLINQIRAQRKIS